MLKARDNAQYQRLSDLLVGQIGFDGLTLSVAGLFRRLRGPAPEFPRRKLSKV